MTPEAQIIFCRLLNYFHHGDYATFKRICEMAHPHLAADRYFAANCFLSAHISGIIEVSESERSTWWWASFDGDIDVISVRPKLIGTTRGWLEHKPNDIAVLITDAQGRTLLMGHSNDSLRCNHSNIFGINFFDRFPGFLEAERDVLIPENFRLELGKYVEIYEPNEGRWKVVDQDTFGGAHLVRARREFSGLTYYIVNSELGLLFRVAHPEWAFITGLNLLNWPLAMLVQETNGILCMPRAVRLPAPVLRFLFASSSLCRIGPNIEFIDIDYSAWDRLRFYLNPRGSEHAAKSH